jgi:hypothetical protein
MDFSKFPIQNGLKQGYALSPLLFNFGLEYAIKKIQENRVGVKLNGIHQVLVYADNVNLLEDSVGTIKKITEALTDASKEVGLEVNAEKSKYIVTDFNKALLGIGSVNTSQNAIM